MREFDLVIEDIQGYTLERSELPPEGSSWRVDQPSRVYPDAYRVCVVPRDSPSHFQPGRQTSLFFLPSTGRRMECVRPAPEAAGIPEFVPIGLDRTNIFVAGCEAPYVIHHTRKSTET